MADGVAHRLLEAQLEHAAADVGTLRQLAGAQCLGKMHADEVQRLGHLLLEGHFTEPRAFYCPDQPNPVYQYATYEAKYQTLLGTGLQALPTTGDHKIRTAYLTNPHPVSLSDNTQRYRLIEEFPLGTIYSMDLMLNQADMAHGDFGQGWNLLKIDGSSRWAVSQTAFDSAILNYPSWNNVLPAIEALEDGI